MKKILAILSAFSVAASSSISVVTCKIDSNAGNNRGSKGYDGPIIVLPETEFESINVTIDDLEITREDTTKAIKQIENDIYKQIVKIVGMEVPDLKKQYTLRTSSLNENVIKSSQTFYRSRDVEIIQVPNSYIFKGRKNVKVNFLTPLSKAFITRTSLENKERPDQISKIIEILNKENASALQDRGGFLRPGRHVDVKIGGAWKTRIIGKNVFFEEITIAHMSRISKMLNGGADGMPAIQTYEVLEENNNIGVDEFELLEESMKIDLQGWMDNFFTAGPEYGTDWEINFNELRPGTIDPKKVYDVEILPVHGSKYFLEGDTLSWKIQLAPVSEDQ